MIDYSDESVFLNRKEEIVMHEGGNLPHWTQDGKVHFVTFRLADSLPQSRIFELLDVIKNFKQRNPEPWDVDTNLKYHRIIHKRTEDLLHNGYGECILARPNIRAILAQKLKQQDGIDYELIAYVIMSNHVHILFLINGKKTLGEIMHSLKGYSARKINEYLGRTGPLWMREYYDRIVRGEDDYKHYKRYIVSNPYRLHPSQYELYI